MPTMLCPGVTGLVSSLHLLVMVSRTSAVPLTDESVLTSERHECHAAQADRIEVVPSASELPQRLVITLRTHRDHQSSSICELLDQWLRNVIRCRRHNYGIERAALLPAVVAVTLRYIHIIPKPFQPLICALRHLGMISIE